MSLTGALSNALSGLTANSRKAGLVSSNISNATTESYGRRVLELSPRSSGTSGGVWIDGVVRLEDAAVLSDRRLSDAQSGFADSLQSYATQVETLFGASGAAGSLTERYATFENALLTASSDPASTQRLDAVALAAQDLAAKLTVISAGVQSARTEADTAIATQVEALNSALSRVDRLNVAISDTVLRNGDASSLMDERQRVIDSVSGIVPLRSVQRDRGMVALYAGSGTVLLDPDINSAPAVLGFTPVATVISDMTQDNGLLSGITLNGRAIRANNAGPLGGGTLGAQLLIRDEAGVATQVALDALARDLIDRFGPGGPDATLGATDAGLFTDAGLAFDPGDETGIAGRIRINALVAPGGAGSWRLRDGLGAAATGAVGDATLINGYADALEALRTPASIALGTGPKSFGQHVADLQSQVAMSRVRADSEQSFSRAQNTALRELELSKGVDTDAELQDLMLIEQHYAANARVMTVVDELMQRLLNI